MRALVPDPSASPALALADIPEPQPGPGELLIRMEAASVNRGEIRNAAGRPSGTAIGWDVAGEVLALGEGVRSFDVGERVVALAPGGGSFAELVVVPAAWSAPLAGGCDPVLAATLPVAGITAVGILRAGRVHAGDRVLITGAAGGVGLLAVQLAAQAKASVSGQVASEERGRAVREAGATDVVVHAGDDAPFEGRYDVVIDGIGGPVLRPLLAASAEGGRMVIFGNSANAPSVFRYEELYGKAITLSGFIVFRSVAPEQAVRDLAGLVDQVVDQRLRITVQATATLAEGLGLIRDLVDRKVTGKVVLTP